MSLEVEPLAALVLGMLAKADVGTVLTVLPSGAVEAVAPGGKRSAFERRERIIATFVAASRPLSQYEVEARLRRGIVKLSNRVA